MTLLKNACEKEAKRRVECKNSMMELFDKKLSDNIGKLTDGDKIYCIVTQEESEGMCLIIYKNDMLLEPLFTINCSEEFGADYERVVLDSLLAAYCTVQDRSDNFTPCGVFKRGLKFKMH